MASWDESWRKALQRYDNFVAHGWTFLAPFRGFVEELARLPEAAGLTAVTSLETLLISPYERYPDWFEGRHLRVRPLSTGDRCRVTTHQMEPREDIIAPIGELQGLLRRLLVAL